MSELRIEPGRSWRFSNLQAPDHPMLVQAFDFSLSKYLWEKVDISIGSRARLPVVSADTFFCSDWDAVRQELFFVDDDGIRAVSLPSGQVRMVHAISAERAEIRGIWSIPRTDRLVFLAARRNVPLSQIREGISTGRAVPETRLVTGTLFSIRPQGGDLQVIHEFKGSVPGFDVDRRRGLAFAITKGSLLKLDIETSEVACGEPSSVDAEKLRVTSDGRLLLWRLDGSGIQLLRADGSREPLGPGQEPSISDDGKRCVVFSAGGIELLELATEERVPIAAFETRFGTRRVAWCGCSGHLGLQIVLGSEANTRMCLLVVDVMRRTLTILEIPAFDYHWMNHDASL